MDLLAAVIDPDGRNHHEAGHVPVLPGRRRSARPGWSRSAMLSGAVLIAGLVALCACGPPAVTASRTTRPTGVPGSSPTPGAEVTFPATGVVPRLTAGSTCPLRATRVASIVGVRMYEESSRTAGSCNFDSTPRGTGLKPSEIRVTIQTGRNDLASLHNFFARGPTGFPTCRPFELAARPDLGRAAFETVCGASPTLGPSSVDVYLPTTRGQLTVSVNRGLAVVDHAASAAAVQVDTLVGLIREVWSKPR